MKFVSSRELRIKPGAVWDLLAQEKDLVLTSNGKPVGILTFADEDSLEDVLATLRQGRAQKAAIKVREFAVARNLDELTEESIDKIVHRSRTRGRRKTAGAKN
jgi:putative NADPH-quinone reductase